MDRESLCRRHEIDEGLFIRWLLTPNAFLVQQISSRYPVFRDGRRFYWEPSIIPHLQELQQHV